MNIKQTLLDFSARTGLSGLESEAAAYGAELLRPYGEVSITRMGTVVCTVRAPKEGGPHLLLDAHIDEIGLIVTYVNDEGFLRVASAGGVDRRLLLASLVRIHTSAGPLDGVICSIPPHLSDGDKKNQKPEECWIDTGLSGEKAKERILPGDRVTIVSKGRELLGGLVSGKAMDDRAGCVSLLCALEVLRGKDLPCGLTVQFSAMEEVGGQGAVTSAYEVNPTHAVAVDVSFAHTPDAKKENTGKMGEGPMIGFSPVLSHEVSKELVRLAEENGIPHQSEIMGGRTSTNADHIATLRGGVVTGLVSIPLKYMHTPIEVVDCVDVGNTGKLLAAYALSLKGGA